MPAEHPVIPGISDATTEPSFHAPWQARLFALTLAAQERGLFDWPAWTDRLSANLKGDAALPDPATSEAHADHYYTAWMRTLEEFLEGSGAASREAINQTAAVWKHAALSTPHGQPILFENGQDTASDQD